MQIEIIIRIQRIVYQVNKFCNRRATRVYDIFSGYFCHRFFYPIRKFLSDMRLNIPFGRAYMTRLSICISRSV